jgi:metal-sulfur cluster biosynthetic enzyme
MATSRQPVEELDPDVLACLSGVTDPEIGLSIVDLGLIYRARSGPQGLDVALTLTSQACPLGELIADNVRARLACRFPAAPDIAVALVWVPAWSPDRISGHSRERLGLPAMEAL